MTADHLLTATDLGRRLHRSPATIRRRARALGLGRRLSASGILLLTEAEAEALTRDISSRPPVGNPNFLPGNYLGRPAAIPISPPVTVSTSSRG